MQREKKERAPELLNNHCSWAKSGTITVRRWLELKATAPKVNIQPKEQKKNWKTDYHFGFHRINWIIYSNDFCEKSCARVQFLIWAKPYRIRYVHFFHRLLDFYRSRLCKPTRIFPFFLLRFCVFANKVMLFFCSRYSSQCLLLFAHRSLFCTTNKKQA